MKSGSHTWAPVLRGVQTVSGRCPGSWWQRFLCVWNMVPGAQSRKGGELFTKPFEHSELVRRSKRCTSDSVPGSLSILLSRVAVDWCVSGEEAERRPEGAARPLHRDARSSRPSVLGKVRPRSLCFWGPRATFLSSPNPAEMRRETSLERNGLWGRGSSLPGSALPDSGQVRKNPFFYLNLQIPLSHSPSNKQMV